MNSNTADNDNELAIELDGLTKRFGKTLAVDDISLAVKRGSSFGLIGPNGAGKRSAAPSQQPLANNPVVGKPFDSVGTTRTVIFVGLKFVLSKEVAEQIKRDIDVLR